MKFNPILAIDGYKTSHVRQYPPGTEFVYSNFTPRTSRVDGVDRVVFFGLQAFLQDYCTDAFAEWFARDTDEVVAEYQAVMDDYLGPGAINSDHIRALHELGYLPLRFRALPEGTRTPLKIPMFTVENTLPEFYWLTNYIESVLSAELWLPCTTATTAWHMRQMLDDAAATTADRRSSSTGRATTSRSAEWAQWLRRPRPVPVTCWRSPERTLCRRSSSSRPSTRVRTACWADRSRPPSTA